MTQNSNGFKIPEEEVKRMKPEDFLGTYTQGGDDWVQHNKVVSGGDVRGLVVFKDGYKDENGVWSYDCRGYPNRMHYRSLEDLVRDYPNEKLLALFMKERCQ